MTDRVLLVEDNDENRAIFATILRHQGFEVIEAENGTRALALARERRPDMMLLDLGLPDMDGFEVMDRMTGDAQLAGLPFIVVTAHVSREVEDRVLDKGARRFLTKPIAPRELAAAVREELEAEPVS